MKIDVFISHSTKDRKAADAACHYLERQGVKCWMAPRDVISGSDWAASIVDAIKRCRMMLLIFSSHANDSGHIRREVNLAGSRNVPIVPFRIEDVPMSDSLSYFLEAPHWLDAITPPVEQHFETLAVNVNALLGRGRDEVRSISDEVVAAPSDDLNVEPAAEATHPSPTADSENETPTPRDLDGKDLAEAENSGADKIADPEPAELEKSAAAFGAGEAEESEAQDEENGTANVPVIPDPGGNSFGWPVILGVLVLVVGGAALVQLSPGDTRNVSDGSAKIITTPLPRTPTPTPTVTPDTAYVEDITVAENIRKGKECFERKDLDCGINAFTKALSFDKANGDALNRRGNAYYDRKEYQMALADYNECIRLQPDEYVCYYNRGISLKALGRFDEAIKDYSKAIELKPDYAFAYNNRGLVYMAKKAYIFAVSDFEKALSLDPSDQLYKQNLENARKGLVN